MEKRSKVITPLAVLMSIMVLITCQVQKPKFETPITKAENNAVTIPDRIGIKNIALGALVVLFVISP